VSGLPDPRLNAFRPDLADARLEGLVEAGRFVAGKPARVVAAVADVRRAPDEGSSLDTQFLLGERVLLFDSSAGWSWVQGLRDNYVGYVRGADLGPVALKPTHEVVAPRTFAYPDPDMKHPPRRALSFGSVVSVAATAVTRGLDYVVTDDGEALVARHLRPVAARQEDFVAYAERLVGTPYLWGGTSAFGVDCSGLVQLALRMAGQTVLRDTPMQQLSIGAVIEPDRDGLQRGDLVFWPGHVAILVDDGQTILHASGHSMDVACEPFAEAVQRIAYLYSRPVAYRRP